MRGNKKGGESAAMRTRQMGGGIVAISYLPETDVLLLPMSASFIGYLTKISKLKMICVHDLLV
jgi:hypothetical protein